MMSSSSSLFLFSLLSLLPLASFEGPRVHLEGDASPGWVPDEWVLVGPAERNHILPLLIHVAPQNTDVLYDTLHAAGEPSSPTYGKWWAKRDVDKLVAPSEASVRAVRAWLEKEGVASDAVRRRTQLWWEVRVPVWQAERMLATTFHTFLHKMTSSSVVRSLSLYTVPASIAEHVTLVGNVMRFPYASKAVLPKVKDVAAASIFTSVTPDFLQKTYDVVVPPTNSSNVQAVGSFLGQYYSASDIQLFHDNFFPGQAASCAITNTVGDNDQSQAGIEAALDTQYIQFGNCSVETWDYSIPGETHADNEPFLNWLLELDKECTTSFCPYVYSLSYGDYENTVSQSYAKAVDLEFQIITMTGRTFLAASGDDGVGCTDIGYGPSSYNCSRFNPIFISTSPHVVSVGSTTFASNKEEGVSFTGGGFSDIFSQPTYQASAVTGYFNLGQGIPASSFFNKQGRGFPDLAVVGVNYMVYWRGTKIPVDGTSCSTPAFASMVSMINTQRFNAGLPPMGFLNPFLYTASASNSLAFNDITTAQTQAHGCCPIGFQAVKGWEPFCGLGTPNYSVLSSLAMSSNVFPHLF